MKSTSRKIDSPPKGKNAAAADMKAIGDDTKDVENAAKATKAKKGGKIVGKVEGEKCRAHGGRAARKSGGACEDSPFSSARAGTPAPGRKLQSLTR